MVENKEKIARPDPWPKEKVDKLKCNPEVLQRLAQVDLSTVCGHDSKFAVSRVQGNGEKELICETCFTTVRDLDSKASLESAQKLLVGQEPCMLCDTPPGGKTAVRLNVDMGGAPVCDVCVINSRQADIELMKTFIPPFEEPNEVVPGVLYIGSKASQVNLEKLQSYGIKRVLICCDVLRAYHKPDTEILYHRLPIKDSLVQNLKSYLPDALAFIAQGALKGEKTLVHCNAGVSRSGSIVVEFIRRSIPLSLTEAYAAARGGRPIITPNSNFLKQLAEAKDDI